MKNKNKLLCQNIAQKLKLDSRNRNYVWLNICKPRNAEKIISGRFCLYTANSAVEFWTKVNDIEKYVQGQTEIITGKNGWKRVVYKCEMNEFAILNRIEKLNKFYSN